MNPGVDEYWYRPDLYFLVGNEFSLIKFFGQSDW